MDDDKYDSIMPPGGRRDVLLSDPELKRLLVMGTSKPGAVIPYGPGAIYGPGKIFPTVDKAGDSIVNAVTIEAHCMEMLFICMPHGYGFRPVLPSKTIHTMKLQFGKLGHPHTVNANMNVDPDFKSVSFFVGDRHFSSNEIRIMAMHIVDRINEINGIDDEQNGKGPE